MPVRPFVMWPDRRLRTPAATVEEITDETRAIWADMVETMDAMPGVGLAAPQIGVMQALAVVDASDARGKAVKLANPRVLHASVEFRPHEEASPNLPGLSALIARPRAVTVAYLDETGTAREEDFVLLRATSVQHQIDHLDGKLYFHRLSKLKRDMLLRKASKCA